MAEALQAASSMTTYGCLRFAAFSGVDIQTLIDDARFWLAGEVPLKDGRQR